MRSRLFFSIGWLVAAGMFSPIFAVETVTIPGTINQICYYTDFFYNLPESDFFYYLNDRLLFTEPPDETVFNDGIRDNLLRVLQRHKEISEFIAKSGKNRLDSISIGLKSDEGWQRASQLLQLLGLVLGRGDNGQIRILEDSSETAVNYAKFLRINIAVLEKQLNKTETLFFKMEESPVPFPFDLRFLKEITDLEVTPSSFFELMLGQKRFSLLLGVLYRLSDNEIGFIAHLRAHSKENAWKRIYQNKKMLMALLVLSSALRVNENQLVFPGGQQAQDFWSELAGVRYGVDPYGFLENLATRDDGKLNYLWLFSFFIPESNLKVMFADFDPSRMRTVYDRIVLAENEKLKAAAFPRLENGNFFSLLYTLKIRDEGIHFPLGLPAWLGAVTGTPPSENGMGATKWQKATALDFCTELLQGPRKAEWRLGSVQKFIYLYSRFFERLENWNSEVLYQLYRHLDTAAILIDYMARIPLKKPETILELFKWFAGLENLNERDRALFTAIVQSLFEMISHRARFATEPCDYDQLVSDLIQIPLHRSVFYEKIFDFLDNRLKIRMEKEIVDHSFLDFILSGITNQTVSLQGEDYELTSKDLFENALNEILQSQEVCSLAGLVGINAILAQVRAGTLPVMANFAEQLTEAFEHLPYADMSEDAPKFIRERVVSYSREDLERDLSELTRKVNEKSKVQDLKLLVEKIEADYLIFQLRDYGVALSYALNAKDSQLKIFRNPNLTRLHDFLEGEGYTPWNFSGLPSSKRVFSGYHLRGGLSRLGILLTASWKDQLFGRNVIYSSEQIQSVLASMLDFYPVAPIDRSMVYIGLLTEFGVELIEKARNNPELKREVVAALSRISAGFHYRKAVDYLNGQADDHYLFFSEMLRIGETFFESGRYRDEFSKAEQMRAFLPDSLNGGFKNELNRFGSVYFHTFGTFASLWLNLFPQEVASWFVSGWTAGEVINEFKIKAAFHSQHSDLPPALLSELVFQYIGSISRQFYSQNHEKDYFSTYFVFDIMNNSHLKNIVKKMKKEGYLRLK